MKYLPPRVKVQEQTRLRVETGSWRPSGAGSTERGYTYAWQKARERFLRAHPLCVMCEAKGLIEAANVVDHKIPHRGDQALFWDESNWQSLCKLCHDSVKQREERAADGLGPQLR